jgi:hypothetical protein
VKNWVRLVKQPISKHVIISLERLDLRRRDPVGFSKIASIRSRAKQNYKNAMVNFDWMSLRAVNAILGGAASLPPSQSSPAFQHQDALSGLAGAPYSHGAFNMNARGGRYRDIWVVSWSFSCRGLSRCATKHSIPGHV